MKPVFIANFSDTHKDRTTSTQVKNSYKDSKSFMENKFGFIIKMTPNSEPIKPFFKAELKYITKNFNPSEVEKQRISAIVTEKESLSKLIRK